MKLRCVILSLAAAAWIAPAFEADSQAKESLDDVRQDLAAKRAVLVDVREQKEWDRGHLQDAQLVPLSQLNRSVGDATFKEELAKRVPKDRIVYCHCAKGVRAAMAGDVLKKLGYDVRPLKAGFDELREAGFPVAKQATPKP